MSQKLQISLVFLLLTACHLEPKIIPKESFGETIQLKSGALFMFEFKSEENLVGKDSCTLTLKEITTKQKLDIDVSWGAAKVIADIAPGDYMFHDFVCGRFHWDLSYDSRPSFRVKEGNISLVEPLRFYINDSRQLSLKNVKYKKRIKLTLETLNSLSTENQSRLVSGYTQTPILKSMVSNLPTFSVHYIGKSAKSIVSGSRNRLSFKSCYAEESKVNPLILGY